MSYIVCNDSVSEELPGHIYVNFFCQDAVLVYRALKNMDIISKDGITEEELSSVLSEFPEFTPARAVCRRTYVRLLACCNLHS